MNQLSGLTVLGRVTASSIKYTVTWLMILNLCFVGAYEIFAYYLFSWTIIYVLIFLCVCNNNNAETMAGEVHARILRLGDLNVFKFTY